MTANPDFGLMTLGSADLFPSGVRTIEVMLLDRSDSMRRFGAAPRAAVNAHLDGLKKCPGAEATAVSLLSFSTDSRCELALTPLVRVADFGGSELGGSTHLYQVVAETLDLLMRFQIGGRGVRIVMPIVTDGEDTGPITESREHFGRVRGMASQVDAFDIQVLVIGIGVDGKRIARHMGFDDGLSLNVEATAEGVHRSMEHSTVITAKTMSGIR